MNTGTAARPFRWIGALAVLGVVSAALVVLAWEAVGESFTFIGDGRAISDSVILATEAPQIRTDDGSGSVRVDLGQTEGVPSEPAVEDEPPLGGERPPATYEVQPGDTGTSIAVQIFGRQQAWGAIAEFNGLAASDTLEVGQVLRIPEL